MEYLVLQQYEHFNKIVKVVDDGLTEQGVGWGKMFTLKEQIDHKAMHVFEVSSHKQLSLALGDYVVVRKFNKMCFFHKWANLGCIYVKRTGQITLLHK
ncbi:hypothetical protein L1987_78286 [Smallanthus sonchifolius]|uniref:Uncharacterized protein n=1 Tax=Smallanthus sonchifolius TaxID=185202 RepID=A0ACB8ZDA8_9ASTR|nr:hypothetical protein L1987_78286 [Smallanthus sonchifolius]